ncbi:MAG: helix-hairpin-helix domain-containing protein [Gammaproteobacteria bacterium]
MEQLVIEIAGIGQATSAVLTKHGFITVADVANTSVDSLSVVPGFANARSLQTIKKAKELLQAGDVSAFKEEVDSVVSKEKIFSKKPIKNKKTVKKSKGNKAAKNKKLEKNKLKLVVKKLAKKLAKLKGKAKKATKKKSSKKSKKK